jgi:chromosome segregation ATPase
MTTLSVINVMPSNKAEVKTFVQDAKERILSGNENTLKIAAQLKAMEEVIKELREDKDIREAVLNEYEKTGKTFQMFNSEFQKKETGVKYDFSVCEDTEWEDLNKEIEPIKAKIKERETFLKVVKNQISTTDGIIINPPVKTSTTTVTVTLL